MILSELAQTHIPLATQKIFFPLLFVGFGVFAALFPFHTWVPDGHSSAPTAGSMFLAGISMKLGGYGCLRVAAWLMPEGAKEYSTIIIVFSAIAILYGAFATMMQKDLKYINAYSSVSHCGFVLLGIGMLTKTAMTGAVMQMVSHGLMTALFFAVIGMIYERIAYTHGERNGRTDESDAFIMTVLFIVGFCSLGLPGLSGFVAEMTVFMGSWENTWSFSAYCDHRCLYVDRSDGSIYFKSDWPNGHGTHRNKTFLQFKDATWNERLAAIILVAGIVAIGVAPFWLNHLISPAGVIIRNW